MTSIKYTNIYLQYSKKLNHLSIIYPVLFALYLSGCATGPKEQGPLFYPALPDPPRIQHLKSFSNVNDLKGGGNLAAFILGGSVNESIIAKPYGVAAHGNKMYVVDSSNGGYAVFDLKEQKLDFVLGTGGGGLSKPINIDIDKDGNKYITDTKRRQVVVFDHEDEFLRAYGEDDQFKPSDVAVEDDRIYVSDLSKGKIHVLDKMSGETLFIFPPDDTEGAAHLAHPTNIHLFDGHIYVTDSTLARVNKYTISGEYVMTYGSMGINTGQFSRPKGITVDKSGNIYVVDAAFSNVQIFSQEGPLLLFFGEPGPARRNINLPSAVALDYDNNDFYQQFAEPGFIIEYVILVVSQYGNTKVNAYGLGKMEGMDYSLPEPD